MFRPLPAWTIELFTVFTSGAVPLQSVIITVILGFLKLKFYLKVYFFQSIVLVILNILNSDWNIHMKFPLTHVSH